MRRRRGACQASDAEHLLFPRRRHFFSGFAARILPCGALHPSRVMRKLVMRSNARKLSRRYVRLELERLEDRWSPAVIPVSNVAQLQSALNGAGNFDTIQMAGGGYFTQGNPVLFDNQAKFVTVQAA